MNRIRIIPALAAAAALAACGGGHEAEDAASHATAVATTGAEWTVRDTLVSASMEASGVAEPYADATLSTKLMGQIMEVTVREGARVAAGQLLVRIDAADLTAKRAQVEAGIREAQAMVADAETQVGRMRALYAEEAAPKAQLDAAEMGLARARAGLATARAAAQEVDAVARYGLVRAPFAGVVSRRFVDPGDFAAPGAPLLTVLDARRLRVRVSAAPDGAAGLRQGDTVAVTIEGVPATGVVEGVVPDPGASLVTVNAIVDNILGVLLPGGAATLSLPRGERSAVLIPAAAVFRQADLTGVRVRTADGAELRWIRVGAQRTDGTVEVLSGLRAGDVVLVPETPGNVTAVVPANGAAAVPAPAHGAAQPRAAGEPRGDVAYNGGEG